MNGALTTVDRSHAARLLLPANRWMLWVPLVQTPPAVLKRENRDTWFVVGRLAEGVTIESARAEMDRHWKAAGDRLPAYQQGLPARSTDVPRVLHRSQRGHNLRVHVGRGGLRPADCVRQSGESTAGARDRQVPRNLRPHRARCGAVADHPSTAHRERDAVGRWVASSAGGLPNGAFAPTSSRWPPSRRG